MRDVERAAAKEPVDASPAVAVQQDDPFPPIEYMAHSDPAGSGKLYFRQDTTNEVQVPNAYLNAAPAMAFFKNTLYLAHQSAGNDKKLYYATFDGSTWSSQQNGSDTVVPGVWLTGSPAMAVFDKLLYLTHQSASGDSKLYYVTFDGWYWSSVDTLADTQVPGVYMNASPTMAVFDKKLYVVHQGADYTRAGGTLWYISYDGIYWSADNQVPDVMLFNSPSAATYKEHLYVAYQRRDSTQSVWYTKYDGNTWSPEVQIRSDAAIAPGTSPTLFVKNYAGGDSLLLVGFYSSDGRYVGGTVDSSFLPAEGTASSCFAVG